MIRFIENEKEKENICQYILEQLPDWFGVPESILEYKNMCGKLPFWADVEGEQIRGFIAMKETSPYTAEICVMGVLLQFHRYGIGKKLFQYFMDYARKHGYEYIQVKTVEEGHYQDYDQTNAFYKSLGFRELECFRTLWDEANPCQVYVMAVR